MPILLLSTTLIGSMLVAGTVASCGSLTLPGLPLRQQLLCLHLVVDFFDFAGFPVTFFWIFHYVPFKGSLLCRI